jgi:hypothetical protein
MFFVYYRLNSSFPLDSPLGKWASQAEFFIHPALNSTGFQPGEPKRLEMLLG